MALTNNYIVLFFEKQKSTFFLTGKKFKGFVLL